MKVTCRDPHSDMHSPGLWLCSSYGFRGKDAVQRIVIFETQNQVFYRRDLNERVFDAGFFTVNSK